MILDDPPEPRPPFEFDEAQVVLMVVAVALATPAILVVLLLKGFVPALVVAGLAVGAWLKLAALIPTEREWRAFHRPRTPGETVLLSLFGLAAVGIAILWLLGW